MKIEEDVLRAEQLILKANKETLVIDEQENTISIKGKVNGKKVEFNIVHTVPSIYTFIQGQQSTLSTYFYVDNVLAFGAEQVDADFCRKIIFKVRQIIKTVERFDRQDAYNFLQDNSTI